MNSLVQSLSTWRLVLLAIVSLTFLKLLNFVEGGESIFFYELTDGYLSSIVSTLAELFSLGNSSKSLIKPVEFQMCISGKEVTCAGSQPAKLELVAFLRNKVFFLAGGTYRCWMSWFIFLALIVFDLLFFLKYELILTSDSLSLSVAPNK